MVLLLLLNMQDLRDVLNKTGGKKDGRICDIRNCVANAKRLERQSNWYIRKESIDRGHNKRRSVKGYGLG